MRKLGATKTTRRTTMKGYAFPIKRVVAGDKTVVGLKENFKVTITNGVAKVQMLLGIKLNGEVADIYRVKNGIGKVEKITKEIIEEFIYSKKIYVSLVDETSMLAQVIGLYDIKERKWLDNATVTCYLPKKLEGEELFCDRVALDGAFNVFESTLEMYQKSVLGQLEGLDMRDRSSFLRTRVGGVNC